MGERTILIKRKDGSEIQIDIPEEWKITFGPAVVGTPKIEGKMPWALRIYETEKLQRAIFTDVESFRDMSIPIREKRVHIQEKQGYVEVDGSRKNTTFQARTAEWVNPDEEAPAAENLLPLPPDTEMFGHIGARSEL